jgi:short-subunit dehydrogenase
MSKVAVVTRAGAAVGRAAVEEFARQGYDIGLLSRDQDRSERAAAHIRSTSGVRAVEIFTDVADANAVEAAASLLDDRLGPIDVWVDVAMATVFAPYQS